MSDSALNRAAGDFTLQTARFTLRPLTEADATERYWSWLQDADVRTYIAAAAGTRDLDDLRAYIAERSGRHDVLFLGIFETASGSHIGNIKYEPLNVPEGYAVMGVLIGEPSYRGRGATTEVLRATAAWLQATHGIREIVLSVDVTNAPAIRVYEKVGFKRAETSHAPVSSPGTVSMVWNLRP
jgi:ribosomal-protein-alanine N-acetyltransferase